MKFVMTQAICQEGMDYLEKKTNRSATVCVAERLSAESYLEEMKTADALIVRIARCDGELIRQSQSLKVIGRTGVGYDNVDVKTATELGIPVVITPGANARSVGEMAVAMMFALSKNMLEEQSETAKGNWEIRNAHKAFELQGKTVGIIGLGAIGREVLSMCKALGMQAAGYDPYLSKKDAGELGVEFYMDYKELLKVSDIVTIHVPLTESTRNMITIKELRMMKPSAVLINCSRGGIVEEADLAEALNGDVIAGAGLDAFCQEPLLPDNPILSCKNIICTPHSAAQTKEAVVKMATMCVDGCLAVCRGERWPLVANPEVYEHPRWKGEEYGNEPL